MLTDGSTVTGYNDVPWTFRHSSQDQFYLDVLPIRRPLMSMKEEFIATAKAIGNEYHGEEIHVFYGGGIDSEIILWSFREAQIPVKAVTIVDLNDTNRLELTYAKRYYAETNFNNHQYVYLNFKDWLSSAECKSVARSIQTEYPSMMVFWPPILNSFKDKPIVMNFYEPVVRRLGTIWYLHEVESMYSAYKFFMFYGINGTPSFNFMNSEIYLSWLTQPELQNLYDDRVSLGINTSVDIKPDFFYKHLKLKPRMKDYWHLKLNDSYKPKWDKEYITPIKPWIMNRVISQELGVRT